MKKSRYDKVFDPMKEVLIEYATMKDDRGCLIHTGPEVCRKFGLGTDANVVDAFNRWLNRNGVRRRKYTRRVPVNVVDELFPAVGADAIPQPQPHEFSKDECEAIFGSLIDTLVVIREHIGAIQETIVKKVDEIRELLSDE